MSSRNARVIITLTALDDIAEILRFTDEEWGSAQRKRYARQIKAVIDRLAIMPLMGRPQDEVYPGVRSLPVGRHLLYYTYQDDVVYIRHVWHDRRDLHAIDWMLLDDEPDNTL
jgi:toxin ParE1/3/4